MTEKWLPSLITIDPQSGYQLALKLSRMAVKITQPDAVKRDQLRKIYEVDVQALINISSVVATHFQTIASANNYWRNTK